MKLSFLQQKGNMWIANYCVTYLLQLYCICLPIIWIHCIITITHHYYKPGTCHMTTYQILGLDNHIGLTLLHIFPVHGQKVDIWQIEWCISCQKSSTHNFTMANLPIQMVQDHVSDFTKEPCIHRVVCHYNKCYLFGGTDILKFTTAKNLHILISCNCSILKLLVICLRFVH